MASLTFRGAGENAPACSSAKDGQRGSCSEATAIMKKFYSTAAGATVSFTQQTQSPVEDWREKHTHTHAHTALLLCVSDHST
eukprot:1632715-Amphidinium_carterae.1